MRKIENHWRSLDAWKIRKMYWISFSTVMMIKRLLITGIEYFAIYFIN